MAYNKHLSLSERILIEKYLHDQYSFKAIGRELQKDCTTISKEIKSHLIFKKTGCFGTAFNDCANRQYCSHSKLCNKPDCRIKFCRSCAQCHLHCKDYLKLQCSLLLKPPYVCNGCKKRTSCSLEKHLYSASYAQKEYQEILSESRLGIAVSEEEIAYLDSIISPLIQKGQSIHHVCASKTDAIMFSEKCIYNYVAANLFSAKNLDLPRKVKYRARKSRHDHFKVDKACRIGRTYTDFLQFVQQNPDLPLVQMDSVEGRKGGKVLLTIHFVESQFMLAYLRDYNTSASVIDIFEQLYSQLGTSLFTELFPVLLTDNGSEFSNPSAIEFDSDGIYRTRIFFCNPNAPYQKGAAENNHTFIRRILPKGTSFDDLTQEKVTLMMNHINSYRRKKLGDRSPHEMFQLFYGKSVLEILKVALIPTNDIELLPVLLK